MHGMTGWSLPVEEVGSLNVVPKLLSPAWLPVTPDGHLPTNQVECCCTTTFGQHANTVTQLSSTQLKLIIKCLEEVCVQTGSFFRIKSPYTGKNRKNILGQFCTLMYRLFHPSTKNFTPPPSPSPCSKMFLCRYPTKTVKNSDVARDSVRIRSTRPLKPSQNSEHPPTP